LYLNPPLSSKRLILPSACKASKQKQAKKGFNMQPCLEQKQNA